MDVADIQPKLKELHIDLDNLEEALEPLLEIQDVASKLPLLDRAKLYVLAAYAIGSLIFMQIRLQGKNPKAHPVVNELARIRQYFHKIEALENPPEERNTSVDTQAAIRFIKADLGDKNLNTKLAEQIAKEKAKVALLKNKSKDQDGKKDDKKDDKKRKSGGFGLDGESSGSQSKSRKLNHGRNT